MAEAIRKSALIVSYGEGCASLSGKHLQGARLFGLRRAIVLFVLLNKSCLTAVLCQSPDRLHGLTPRTEEFVCRIDLPGSCPTPATVTIIVSYFQCINNIKSSLNYCDLC